MPIANPSPFTPNEANQLWATKFTLTPNLIAANLSPTDGTLLVANRSKVVSLSVELASDTSAQTLASDLTTQLAAISGRSTQLRAFNVSAPDPEQKIKATCVYASAATKVINGQTVSVPDLYLIPDVASVMAANPAAAAAYAAVITWLAGKVG